MKRGELITGDGQAVMVPRLDQYFGLWACEPQRMRAMVEQVRSMDLAAHVAEGAAMVEPQAAFVAEGGVEIDYDRDEKLLIAEGGVALIDLSGVMTKYGSSLSTAGSTVVARQRLARAMKSSKVKSILLRIDSPGGSVSGVDDLARDVAAANQVKPVTAYIEDIGASAAYYVASQAGQVLANASAVVGSIGVFMLIYDYSGEAAQLGIKAVLIKAGEMKGAGAPGTEITEAQKDEWQREVDEAYAMFVMSVARGRGMDESAARALADGRVWGVQDAQDKGLIDGVMTFAEAIDFARQEKTNRLLRAENQRRSKAMNFMDAIKAVLEGRSSEAHADHRELAEEAVAAVRAHDEPAHNKAVADAVAKAQAEAEGGDAAKAAKSADDAVQAERERAAEIIEICGKLGLSDEKTATYIKGGEDLGKVAKQAVAEAAKRSADGQGGGVKYQQDYQQGQPKQQAGEGDEALLAAGKRLTESR